MSQVRRNLEIKEQKHKNKLNGYGNKLFSDNKYDMECPYCCEALSIYDIQKLQCIHCGHELLWNVGDQS